MSTIAPFQALRPEPKFASAVASKPYDVLNSHEAREEAADNPYSFLHITKSEVDMPLNVDTHSQEVYDQARLNLQGFIERGVLVEENKPCFYIYRLIMNERQQTGLVCCSSVDDYENGIIKKHELTRPDKEADRIHHMTTTRAQTGNVFLAYRSVGVIDDLIESWKRDHHPLYDFTAPDGIAHTVWVVDDEGTMRAIPGLFAVEVPFTYIADGHHRAASAAKARKALGAGASLAAGFFLTTLFPSDQLRIMDYNRLGHDLNGDSDEEFIHRLRKEFMV